MAGVKLEISKKNVKEFKADLLVAFAYESSEGGIVIDTDFKPILDAISAEEFEGKKDQHLMLYPSLLKKQSIFTAKRILLLGLGELEKQKESHQLFELLRLCGGIIASKVKSCKVKNIGIKYPDFKCLEQDRFAEHIVEGVCLGDYQFLKYKKIEKNQYGGLKKLSILEVNDNSKVRRGMRRGENSANAGRVARDMANEPGNGWTPSKFAEYAQKIAKEYDIKSTIFDKPQLEKLGMGGLLAVNQGSPEPPKFVILDYKPRKKADTILLVGKGLTFDSGGISLKPAQGMMDMKYDMCGGAAVLSAMEVIAKEKPEVRVVAIVPSTDNMAGGGAVKPGDVIQHYGGITSEIENTDAEGRLILADALAYGIEKYKPTCVIDLATLTGAVIIALGHHHTGLMSNNDSLVEQLIAAGSRCGEPLWRLPLGDEYVKQIKSDVADIKNTGGRPAGSITAAEYLHKFVDKTPWAHLDIAGTAWDFTEKTYIPKGPSGNGTRTLIELVRKWENGGCVPEDVS